MQTAFTPRDNRSINQLERYGTVGTAGETGAHSHGDLAGVNQDDIIYEEDRPPRVVRRYKLSTKNEGNSVKSKRKKSKKPVLNPYEKSLVSFIDMKNLYN